MPTEARELAAQPAEVERHLAELCRLREARLRRKFGDAAPEAKRVEREHYERETQKARSKRPGQRSFYDALLVAGDRKLGQVRVRQVRRQPTTTTAHTRHRRASRPAPVRRRGSKRTTSSSSRAGPSDDPDPSDLEPIRLRDLRPSKAEAQVRFAPLQPCANPDCESILDPATRGPVCRYCKQKGWGS